MLFQSTVAAAEADRAKMAEEGAATATVNQQLADATAEVARLQSELDATVAAAEADRATMVQNGVATPIVATSDASILEWKRKAKEVIIARESRIEELGALLKTSNDELERVNFELKACGAVCTELRVTLGMVDKMISFDVDVV